jgi:hypothetical protein
MGAAMEHHVLRRVQQAACQTTYIAPLQATERMTACVRMQAGVETWFTLHRLARSGTVLLLLVAVVLALHLIGGLPTHLLR